MDARFRLAAPADVRLTLTLTASVEEWSQIMNDLQGEHAAGVEFAKKLSDLLGKVTADVATERWTTGYANGPVGAA